jgi:pantoate--beta-alanine ligase
MPLEGAGRPGHFRGVTTVVTKLFNVTRPHVAAFGQKDYQQLAIVRRMVADLDMGIEIVAVPTVREPDGLALSSRNRRLPPTARTAAVCVPRALDAVAEAYAAGAREVAVLEAAGAEVVAAEAAARLEYLSIRDASTLEPLTATDRPAVALTAVWFDDLRLIDNRLLG